MSGNRAKELALAHWEGYVKPTIEVHMTSHDEGGIPLFYSREKVVSMCRHHYLSAWEHGAKHEREAQKETAREAMQPLPESVTGNGKNDEASHARAKTQAKVCSSCKDQYCSFADPGAIEVYLSEPCKGLTTKDSSGVRPTHILFDGKMREVAPSAPLSPVFALITEEYRRSLELHKPWEEANHSVQTMLLTIQAECMEVMLAVSQNDYEDTVKELVHVANVAVKAISELTRRGRL